MSELSVVLFIDSPESAKCVSPGQGGQSGSQTQNYSLPPQPFPDLGAVSEGKARQGAPRKDLRGAKVGRRKHHSSSLNIESWSSDNHAAPLPRLHPGGTGQRAGWGGGT